MGLSFLNYFSSGLGLRVCKLDFLQNFGLARNQPDFIKHVHMSSEKFLTDTGGNCCKVR